MSTLRVSNIEAKADASSPTIDEKVKITNSQGRVLMQVDGVTAGITTVGINTTGNTFTVSGSNVTFSGSVTSSGVSTFSNGIVVSSGSTSTPSISPSGDSNTGIFFPSPDTVVIGEGGSEVLRVNSSGFIGINNTNPEKLIEVGAANTTSKFQLSPHGSGWDLGVTSGNIAPHYQTNITLYNGQIGSGATRWQINNSGQTTIPFQPSFRAGRNASYSPGANSDIVFNDTVGTYHHNTGGHYNTSNGRFTCPVAGRYLISFQVIWESLASGTAMDDCAYIYVNGNLAMYSFRRSNYVVNTTGSSGYYVDFGTCILSLNASDFVTIRNRSNLTVHGNTYYSWFAGYLLG
jgi:hypothetical protein